MRRGYYHKYNAKKVVLDGIRFDSTREAERWKELCLLQRAGKIHDLRRQVKYELIPEQREPDSFGPRGGLIRGKTIEKACCYYADFVYTEDGQTVVEDVKGMRTPEYVIKRKLLLWRYGIRIRETK